MADFSLYGGASKEWLAIQHTVPVRRLDLPVAEFKATTNTWREERAVEAMKKLGSQVTITSFTIPTRDQSHVGAHLHWPVSLSRDAKEGKPPLYFFLHGGGFLFGSLSSEDPTAAALAIDSNIPVLNVNYRHTPEFTYPTCFDDVQDAFVWVHEHISELGVDPNRIIVGGVSAGGNLTASLVLEHHLGRLAALTPGKTLPPIAGQILTIPTLVNYHCYGPQLAKLKDPSVSSYKQNEHAPLLPKAVMDMFTDLLKAPNPDPKDTKLNPGNASPEQVRGLPPTLFLVCGLDPLRDEGLLYAKLLAEAGVPTNIHVFKGVPHGFIRYGAQLKAGQAFNAASKEGMSWLLTNPAATGEFQVQVHTEDDD